jgi:epoxyqueuosine reductase QueG
MGTHAVAPELASFHKVDLKGFTSSWSQRHVAYAAGLGTFGLSDGFITHRGIAMRCASVVTDVAIKAARRPFKDHYGACLFYQGGECGKCIQRCPAGAISEKGHDKKKCSDYLTYGREIVRQRGQEAEYIGLYPGCGLCQTKVPCEAGIPKAP